MCTDPCNMGQCIIMLKHGVIAADEWHNNRPQLPSIKCNCSQRWHQQTARRHEAIHAVCHLLGTVETGIHPWRASFSSVPVTIEGEHLPTEVGYDAELQSGHDHGEDAEHADELPWHGFWQFVQNFFCCAAVRNVCVQLTLPNTLDPRKAAVFPAHSPDTNHRNSNHLFTHLHVIIPHYLVQFHAPYHF
jgi:hypothetical protein